MCEKVGVFTFLTELIATVHRFGRSSSLWFRGVYCLKCVKKWVLSTRICYLSCGLVHMVAKLSGIPIMQDIWELSIDACFILDLIILSALCK